VLRSSGRVLDPLERSGEILFGVIMVLSFTGSISIAEGAAAETRDILAAAIGCNVAWGIVDAAMYLITTLTERARGLATLRAIRQGRGQSTTRRLFLDALPPVVASVLTPSEADALCDRLAAVADPEPSAFARLTRADLLGATGIFLLVSLSTFPIVIPFFVMREVSVSLRVSNAIAIAMMFATGWSLGHYTGRSGWHTGLGMVAVGVVLVGITMALGG
jgi:VIT1/CCC1 family predicted Fe2+/Mn2+ transporter